jgi:hypothetical protein
MFEIAASARPPLASLLRIALSLLILGALMLWRATPSVRRRVIVASVVVGALLSFASAALWSRRHAGTGTETAYGWPRVVYARWESFEGGAGRAGVQWRGVVENSFAYGSATMLALAAGLLMTRRRRLSRPA